MGGYKLNTLFERFASPATKDDTSNVTDSIDNFTSEVKNVSVKDEELDSKQPLTENTLPSAVENIVKLKQKN